MPIFTPVRIKKYSTQLIKAADFFQSNKGSGRSNSFSAIGATGHYDPVQGAVNVAHFPFVGLEVQVWNFSAVVLLTFIMYVVVDMVEAVGYRARNFRSI